MNYLKSKLLILFVCIAAQSLSSIAHAKIDFDNFQDISLYGKLGQINPSKTPFLGTQIGAGPNIFGLVEADGNLKYRAKGAELTYKTNSDIEYFFDLQNTNANNSQFFETIDPQGANLLIPGVGVGPSGSGFSLAGPNNQVTNARYTTTQNAQSFRVGIQKNIESNLSSLKLTPSFSINYNHTITTSTFAGDIPFFLRSLEYKTKARIDTISPNIGLDIAYDVNKTFKFFTGGHFSYDFNWGKATDTLSFTGFDDQTAKIRNDENTRSYGLKAGVEIKIPTFPVLLTLQGNYKKFGNLPIIDNRDGSAKSDISYKDTDLYSGQARVTFQF